LLKLFVYMSNFVAQPLNKNDRGATAVEYGLMVALIAAVIIASVTLIGTKLVTLFGTISSGL
jgi:pilus assembly protein Flp/PilA